MSDKLAGIRAKIEWTKKHISDLKAGLFCFGESRPYKVGIKNDAESRKLVYYVLSVEPVPDYIPQIAGDVFANMVSVLDHLAYGLFLKANPAADAATDGRHIYFPITNATSNTEHKSRRERKVKGIPNKIVDALDALEPYKGGKGNQLWALNELNNLSKHRNLIAVGSQFRSFDVGALGIAGLEKLTGMPLPKLPVFLKPADPLCPLKVGDELFIDSVDAKPNYQMQFQFEIALNEPQIIHAQPLIETVNQLLHLVSQIVADFSSDL